MEAKELDCVIRFVNDNRKAFEEGVDSDALKEFHEKGSFPGYTLQGVQRKLNQFCEVKRPQINGKKTRIYILKR